MTSIYLIKGVRGTVDGTPAREQRPGEGGARCSGAGTAEKAAHLGLLQGYTPCLLPSFLLLFLLFRVP